MRQYVRNVSLRAPETGGVTFPRKINEFLFLSSKYRTPRFFPEQKLRSLNLERDIPKEGGWAMVPIERPTRRSPDRVYNISVRNFSSATTDLCDRGDSRVSLRVVLNSSSLRCPVTVSLYQNFESMGQKGNPKR